MIITLSNIDELQATKVAIEEIKQKYPALFEKLLDTINLTRALQFKYQFMGCLIMDQDPDEYKPNLVYSSVLRLYKNELQKIKDDQDFPFLKNTIEKFSSIGYPKICQLVLGMKPESIVGTSSIR